MKEATIVFPIADGVEDLEYYVTRMRLEEAGFRVLSAGITKDDVIGKNGKSIQPIVITNLTEIDKRNSYIYDLIYNLKEKDPSRKVLILSGRKVQLEKLNEMLKGVFEGDIGFYVGGMKEKDLKISESKDLILATFEMVSEGLDIQALDTMIMCTPKASIVQTVGRILRMPEAKHYDSEELNVGYIFTDLENVIIKKEEYNLNIIKHLSSKLVPQIDELNLKSYYIPRVDYGDLTSNFIGIFEKNFCNFFNLTEDSITIKENIDLLLEYTPYQLNPSKWESIIKKFNYIEDKKTNLAYTDLYPCKKCKGRKGVLRQMQNRSADEGATTWFDCYLCGASCKF
jgi:DNA-directed RNA polymerase subunit M/transcription elongation factor TFIIS